MTIKRKRKDCFFGLHFDFHATKTNENIGINFDEKVLANILDQVKPDFVQCDTKGHYGVSSYPTKVGNPAPNIKKDILKEWRRITKERGIPLYAHYSGIMDSHQTETNPEWASLDENGVPNKYNVSLLSDYLEKVNAPQLIEMAVEYGINGVWQDGDCWAITPDYGEKMVAEYKKQTGKDPAKKGEDGYYEFLEFNRRCFYEYLTKLVKTVKEKAPNFEMTSNWYYSSQAPNEYIVPLDYVSGDLTPTDSVDSARYESRIMNNYDIAHDLMSWGISFPVHHVKPSVQLCQEAATTIATGCGFQIYTMQSPTEVVADEWGYKVLKDVSKFVGDRKEYCHAVKSKTDVAIIESLKAFYDKKETMFGIGGNDYNYGIRGALFSMLDNGIPTDVLLSHMIKDDTLNRYKLLVLTEATAIEAKIKEKLIEFVKNGGKLLIFGADMLSEFGNELGLKVKEKYVGNNITTKLASLNGEWMEVRKPYAVIEGDFDVLSYMKKGEVHGDLSIGNPPPHVDFIESVPAIIHKNVGKGEIVGLAFDYGNAYMKERTVILRELLAFAIDKMYDRKIKINERYVDVAINVKNGEDVINLVNVAGEHRAPSVKTIDYIPAIHDIKVEYKYDYIPSKIINGVTKQEIPFEIEGDRLVFTVDKLEIHSAFVLKK